jgi:hypothetical protein
MWRSIILICLGVASLAAESSAHSTEFRFRDGDRVVFIGGTLVEREQLYGCWETMLTSQFPSRNITFRNLGWQGDTVWGVSRGARAPGGDGFAALVDQVTAARPTVIVFAYGNIEAETGKEQLPQFVAQAKKLFDALDRTKARIAILAPLDHEKIAEPASDPAAYNTSVWHYRDALHEFAVGRDYGWIELGPWLRKSNPDAQAVQLTTDGVLLSPVGYLLTAAGLENDLQLPPAGWKVELDAGGKLRHASGTDVAQLRRSDNGLQFELRSHRLPFTAVTREPGREGSLRVHDLPKGRYQLRLDDRKLIEAGADDWASGVALDNPAESRQIDELRAAIIQKNQQLFIHWRPQDFGRLFGLDKPVANPGIADPNSAEQRIKTAEARIAELRVPKTYRFELLLVP